MDMATLKIRKVEINSAWFRVQDRDTAKDLDMETFILIRSCSDLCWSTASLKQMSNNGFDLTSVMNEAGEKGGTCTALCVHKYNQKYTQVLILLCANHVQTQSSFRTP